MSLQANASMAKSKSMKDGKSKRETKPKQTPDWVVTNETKALAAHPLDFTFKKLKKLEAMEPEDARLNRLGILRKGPNMRLLTRSLWLNNNRISSLRNLQDIVNNTIESPQSLGFLDLSCNELTEIHSDLFRFPNITVLYLHGNKLNNPMDIFSLRQLPKLQHLTMYANPLYDRTELGNMRQLVAGYLPNLSKLDHNKFTSLERDAPLSANALKILRQMTGMPPDWLFQKFPIPKLTPEIERQCNLNNKNPNHSNVDKAEETQENQQDDKGDVDPNNIC